MRITCIIGFLFCQLYLLILLDLPNPQEAQTFLRMWYEFLPHLLHLIWVFLFFLPIDGVPFTAIPPLFYIICNNDKSNIA